jgi:peptidyl-prolyl cis-trans isomerase B (cyclophilin B)
VLQCGDPTGKGTGSPGYRYQEENLPKADTGGTATYAKGTVAMAKTAGADQTGSQFFLVYEDSELGPEYTVLGHITKGLDVLEKIGKAGVEGGGSDGAPKAKTTLETVTTTAG